ncbi:hypothetical protein PhCBS80983_g03969 [Powellomyces hirtus]|uniref:HbrB-like protein n=1 Tax=Powellomyces hirtus TaxID=109895 RepID=A0A507E1Q9_9FUNG|nr:hypothetical protein PhCBS80983_g03969 [Powellomyces hirtus]
MYQHQQQAQSTTSITPHTNPSPSGSSVSLSSASFPVPPKRKSSHPPTPRGLTPSFSSSTVSGISKSISTLEVGRTAASLSAPANSLPRETAAEATNRANAWQTLCVRVLPLFNGQGLKGHMEDMNDLVSTWLGDSHGQSIADDLNEMLTTGLLTLSSKLAVVGDEVLASRVVEVWIFFFSTVVPYLQGVFLPVRTQWRQAEGRVGDPPDVRTMSLIGFRDQILIPLSGRLIEGFPRLSVDIENGRKHYEQSARNAG